MIRQWWKGLMRMQFWFLHALVVGPVFILVQIVTGPSSQTLVISLFWLATALTALFWRLCFIWKRGEAFEAEIVDYH